MLMNVSDVAKTVHCKTKTQFCTSANAIYGHKDANMIAEALNELYV